jgi:hypothetical protein
MGGVGEAEGVWDGGELGEVESQISAVACAWSSGIVEVPDRTSFSAWYGLRAFSNVLERKR